MFETVSFHPLENCAQWCIQISITLLKKWNSLVFLKRQVSYNHKLLHNEKKNCFFRCYSSQPQNIKGIQSNNLFRVCFFDKINYYCRKSHAPQKRSDFLKKKNNDSERINRKIFQFFFYIKDTIRIWWCWSQGSLFSNDILWALWL